jgi:hypothetical protein
MKRSFFIMLITMFIAVWGCSSSSTDDVATSINSNSAPSPEPKASPEEFFTSQGLNLLKGVEVNGDKGWLCEFPGKFTQGTGLDGTPRGPVTKKCMVLTGKPYSLGYQSASLMPEEGYAMCKYFLRRVALDQLGMFGIQLPQEGERSDKLFKLIYDSTLLMGKASEPDIPEEYIEEMKGFVDGMHNAGHPDITYEDLLVLNQAVDATYYLLGSVLGYNPITDKNKKLVNQLRLNMVQILIIAGQKDTDPKLFLEKNGFRMQPWGCNELALTGKATVDGKTYHGRDFMFGTADIYQDCAVIAVFMPDKGHPFATVTVPGFIGQSIAMNSEGLSAGQDICQVGVTGITPGVGSMLVLRDIVQNCGNLDEAVKRMRAISRGVSWIYFIADDETDSRWGNAVELETITNQYKVAGPEKINVLERLLFLPYINKLDEDQLIDGYIDGGVLVRGMTWEYPKEFIGNGNDALDPTNIDLYRAYYGKGIHFPMQHETDPDIVAATNHFIIPRLTILHYDPVVYLGYTMSGQLAESIWRYENMENYVARYKGSITYFGDGDYPVVGSAGWIIDFLNTQRDYPWFYRGTDLSNPVNRTVEGHHAVINNDDRIMTGLFGYMTDSWVKIELMNFVKWHY